MAWTTPPTFTTGNVLTATQLNILSDNLSYLYGVLQSPMHPFHVISISATDAANSFYFRYRKRYLHYKSHVFTGSTVHGCSLWVNGTKVFEDTNDRGSEYVYSGYVDLTSGLSLTENNLYEVHWDLGASSGGFAIDWLRLSGSTTL